MRFTNGASSLSECMLRELKSLNNVNVVLDDAVQSVENYEQQAKKHGDDVLVTTKSGKVYQCKQVIGAISPQLCSKIEFKVCLKKIRFDVQTHNCFSFFLLCLKIFSRNVNVNI